MGATGPASSLCCGLGGCHLWLALGTHDLRHSVAPSGGMSLPIIGKTVGHTQQATTQRYAHLVRDPVAAAAEYYHRQDRRDTGGRRGEVVPLRRVKGDSSACSFRGFPPAANNESAEAADDRPYLRCYALISYHICQTSGSSDLSLKRSQHVSGHKVILTIL